MSLLTDTLVGGSQGRNDPTLLGASEGQIGWNTGTLSAVGNVAALFLAPGQKATSGTFTPPNNTNNLVAIGAAVAVGIIIIILVIIGLRKG